MAASRDSKIEPESATDRDEEGDFEYEQEVDLDVIEPSVLWRALSEYTTDMVEDDEWVDPELLPVYAVVLSNLAQVVAKLTNEPVNESDEDEEDE
jgi:hypothetical protein